MTVTTKSTAREKRGCWDDYEIGRLCRDYPDKATGVIADSLNRPKHAVYSKAAQLGLKKSDTYLSSPQSGRLQKGHTNKAGRFQKGHHPANKGKKGWQSGGNSVKTQFKKGRRPHTWKPIGSERITKDGYLQRKVTDTGNTPRDWVGMHILLWKEHYGEVPPGHLVVFRNKNKNDIRIENLELITRAKLMSCNTIQNYPPELKRTIRLAGKLRRKIRDKEQG